MSWAGALGSALLGGQDRFLGLRADDRAEANRQQEFDYRRQQDDRAQNNFLSQFNQQGSQFDRQFAREGEQIDYGKGRDLVADQREAQDRKRQAMLDALTRKAQEQQMQATQLGIEHFETPAERRAHELNLQRIQTEGYLGRGGGVPMATRIEDFATKAMDRHADALGVKMFEAQIARAYQAANDPDTADPGAAMAQVQQLMAQRQRAMQQAQMATLHDMSQMGGEMGAYAQEQLAILNRPRPDPNVQFHQQATPSGVPTGARRPDIRLGAAPSPIQGALRPQFRSGPWVGPAAQFGPLRP